MNELLEIVDRLDGGYGAKNRYVVTCANYDEEVKYWTIDVRREEGNDEGNQ